MDRQPNREIEVFNSALERTTSAERAAYLDGACGEDAGLRARIEALIRAHELAGGFLPEEDIKPQAAELAETIATTAGMVPVTEKPGDRIGRYKLLQQIGEGGCGVVYMAEQQEPVRRKVALKVIKLGMDTKSVIARFEAERQALALMDHPNIAKVLDAGATDTGRPYFVMELVHGTKITDYCDANSLDITTRLNLFIQICQAVQHAHQKGIIHRDLKPSNILVTLRDGVPVPKVIDFGIAKATTDQRLTDKTVFTAFEQFMGTPAYMSPEQAELSEQGIDTRSDIYSLGILLYELLTGGTPFDAKQLLQSGLDAMRKTIRETEPMRPSTKLSTMLDADLTAVAQRHSAESPKLIHLIRGDLDWIVMKALEKDRTRRYETANGLAADIKRHLNSEPVVARPPSNLYRFQKMVRRNKLVFAAGIAITAALLMGIFVSTWQAVRAIHAKKEALAAQADEAQLRRHAQVEELAARQRAYASDMNLIQQALANNNLRRAQDLLNRQRPAPNQQDLRGWEWRYLWQQCRSEASFTVCQKTNQIEALVASGDGHWLATKEVGMPELCVLDLRTHQEVARLHTGITYTIMPIPNVDFCDRESLLAYYEVTETKTNRQHRVILWSAATRQAVGEIKLDGICGKICFAADGKTVGILTEENGNYAVSIWRVSDQKRLLSRNGLQCDWYYAAFTQNLNLLAYGDRGGQLHVLNLEADREYWAAQAAKGSITALAFSPDGKMLVSGEGFAASPINLWDVASGKKLGVAEGHYGWVSALVFLPDGKTLVSASGDETIRLWDVSEGDKPRPKRILRGSKSEVWSLSLFTNGITLISGAKDGSICGWDISSGPANPSHFVVPETIVDWEFGSDGSFITILDHPIGQSLELVEWKGSNYQSKGVEWMIATNIPEASINILSGGQLLGILSTNGILRVLDWRNGQIIHDLTLGDTNLSLIGFLRLSHRCVALNEADGSLSAWDIATGRKWPLGHVDLNKFRVDVNKLAIVFSPCLKFISPNEQWAIFSQGRDRFQLINLLEGKTILVVHDIRQPVRDQSGAAFSPDGNFFAMGSYEGFVKIWEVAPWREVGILRAWLQAPHSMTFSPDARRLAVGSDGKEAVTLFDTQTHEELLKLSADGSIFEEVQFSPDGRILGAKDDGGNLNLWRAPSWEEIAAAENTDNP